MHERKNCKDSVYKANVKQDARYVIETLTKRVHLDELPESYLCDVINEAKMQLHGNDIELAIAENGSEMEIIEEIEKTRRGIEALPMTSYEKGLRFALQTIQKNKKAVKMNSDFFEDLYNTAYTRGFNAAKNK